MKEIGMIAESINHSEHGEHSAECIIHDERSEFSFSFAVITVRAVVNQKTVFAVISVD